MCLSQVANLEVERRERVKKKRQCDPPPLACSFAIITRSSINPPHYPCVVRSSSRTRSQILVSPCADKGKKKKKVGGIETSTPRFRIDNRPPFFGILSSLFRSTLILLLFHPFLFNDDIKHRLNSTEPTDPTFTPELSPSVVLSRRPP